MTTDDDRFDDTVRDLLRLAGSDAPTETHTVSTRSVDRHLARYLTMAAASVVAIGAVAVVAAHRHADGPSVSAPVTATTAETTATDVSSTTLPGTAASGQCSLSGITAYEEGGSVHTILESPLPIEVTVTIDGDADTTYCSGDVVSVTLAVVNLGGGTETIDPQLILSNGPTNYPLTSDANARLELRPGATESTTIRVTLPGVPAGDYSVGLYGFDSWAPVTVANPPVCDDSRVTTTATGDGAMGTIRGILTITNASTSPCFVGHVYSVLAVRAEGDQPISRVFPIDELDASVLPPLASHVLGPGSTASIVVEASDVCPGATSDSGPTSGLILSVSFSPEASITIDVTGLGLHTECGFAMSAWGASPT